MAIRVLSIDEALEDIKKSILEKGRGPDKKPRKRRRGIKPEDVMTHPERYTKKEAPPSNADEFGERRGIKPEDVFTYVGPKNMSPGEQKQFDEYIRNNRKSLDAHFKKKRHGIASEATGIVEVAGKVLTYSMSKKRHGIASEATTEKLKDDVKLERKQRGVKESREDRHPRGGHMWD